MRKATVAGVVVLVAACACAVAGGRLTGTVYRCDGRDVWMGDMVAFQAGETQGVVENWATSVYTYGDIAPGVYCLFNDNAWANLAFWIDGVEVVDGQTRHRDIRVKAIDYLGSSKETWPDAWVHEIGQTFLATGTSITQVNLKIAAIDRDLVVCILEDGPGGAQVGPERAIYLKRDQSGSVYWKNGEVATVPGKRYYIKITSPWGALCQTWASRSNTLAYAYGCAWGDGVAAADRDIAGYVTSDADGVRTTLAPIDYGNYKYIPEPPVDVVMTQYCAQEFTARGAMVVGASCPVEYSDGLSSLRFTIREGSPDGPQVGPAKTVIVPSGHTARAAWREGEVPVSAGSTYFLRVEPVPSGTSVTVQKLLEQHDGSMWLDGAEVTDGDLYCKVIEYDGYDPMTITNIRVTPAGGGSVVVSWDTDVASTSQVEYWSTSDHVALITDIDETPVTAHSVTISGLAPDETYEFVCKSYAPGYRWTVADAVTADAGEPAEFAWSLQPGWNLLGLTDTDVPIADCRLDDGVEQKSWDDAVAAGWVQDGIFYYTGSGYGMTKSAGGDDDRIRDGLGYWVLNQSGGNLTMYVP